jgi:hypothetical protein
VVASMSHLPSLPPSIRINGSSATQQNDVSRRPISSSPTMPMPIRNASRESFVPPPALPPPRFVPGLYAEDMSPQHVNGRATPADNSPDNRNTTTSSSPSLSKMSQSDDQSRPGLARYVKLKTLFQNKEQR